MSALYPKTSGRRGFTLLELSIVMLIIGLIAGGVMVGRELIAAAEVRGTMTQGREIVTVIRLFEDRYMAMPGDMKNAYDFFNNDDRCNSDTVVTDTDDDGCNGDGNGYTEHGNGEHFKAWIHLSMARLIPGNYTGKFDNHLDYQVDINHPLSPVGAGWLFYYKSSTSDSYTSGSNLTTLSQRLYLRTKNGLTIKQAGLLDQKYDDGRPGQGKIIAPAYCTIGDNQNTDTAVYEMDNTVDTCGLDFIYK